MYQTRNDYQSTYDDKYEFDPLAKKIRQTDNYKDHFQLYDYNSKIDCPPLISRQSAGTFTMNIDSLVKNDIAKLSILPQSQTQSSSSNVIPTRKRRYRNSHDLSTLNSSACSTTNTDGQVRTKPDLSCVVCCAVAHGYNFDAISCESCKAFFRRNALINMDRLKCRRDQDCEITLETRRRCKSCRLKKCFSVGMRKEWILTEEEKMSKKRRIEENRKLRFPNSDDPISIKNNLDLQTALFNKTSKASIKVLRTAQNSDVIANVVLAYYDSMKSDVTSYAWSYPLARKITAICQIINARSTTALRLINFYKRLHDFDILIETDKVNLIKNNLWCIFFFHASLGYDPIADVYHEENTNRKSINGGDICEAYGFENYTRLTKIVRALNSIAQIDKRLIQVALVIFLFSTNLSTSAYSVELIIANCEKIFRIQNVYTEQLWLLTEKIYGCVRAVRIFSTLISQCLLIQRLLQDVQQGLDPQPDPFQVPAILRSVMQSA
ncbi:unnamed protein product [Adineta ricciae]|uniref:Nuclear receptor domain-containing protein n=1 Tax=Adineta ricciae TaxID=249248 RepID=A0A815X8X3_ADIRI|nr:unnamed protein product [Adineta ricciae]